MPNVILLGEGVFSIGATAIGLTRGGGKFEVKREFKEMEADGDFGKVKGRIRKTKSEATLTINALEILPANLPKMFAATEVDTTTTAGHTIFQANDDIVDDDYQATVTFTGKTKSGKAVVITLSNAINLEGINWELKDKEEIITEVTYTGCYTDADRITEPWKVDFAD